mmetsp:Transcript_6826/g.7813  ORF Transcript_6826/g.7813 Transcript_6826/m.7813 type:complete len:386 (-) Transcript_6826:371-1528(-)|eukprot:CAMPEP_0197845464 /NCGR_PEP_ID=MMETSP1438-20131217/2388_1 /TAXON_ID=1461541 /ORGANISM="Pterosperma sp., Strain CCMP1384" /LENGTH=385 /DNA_ID=CAMNT_0043456765 /DNA_START=168 /DNA_END=1325 /DNA_ORIENTATION=+
MSSTISTHNWGLAPTRITRASAGRNARFVKHTAHASAAILRDASVTASTPHRLFAPLRFTSSRLARTQRKILASGDSEPTESSGGDLSTPPRKDWSLGTVVENNAGNADSSLRELKISVADEVEYLEGVRFKGTDGRTVQPRWIDEFRYPGQFVGLSLITDPEAGAPTKSVSNWTSDLLNITSSPYQARAKSASLDASIIELLIDSSDSDKSSKLAALKPGDQVYVSSVVGKGFVSMFDNKLGLNTSMEEQRDLVMVASGSRGIAALHSALSWTPVMAHAGTNKVTLFYECDSVSSAAYLAEWDMWRDAGIRVVPIYKEKGSEEGTRLIDTLFDGPGGFATAIESNPEECAVLIAGTKGLGSVALMRMLTNRGVQQERVLYCDFF